MSADTWNTRSLLSPVVARLLIYGTNPLDLEGILSQVEKTPLRSADALESSWLDAWDALAKEWDKRASIAFQSGNHRSVQLFRQHATSARLARFLVNTSDLDLKRKVYLEYAQSYRAAMDVADSPVLSVQIPLKDGRSLSALLHLPSGAGPHPCVVIFSGLGSCKEEMHTLARPMVERGIAALMPDAPGSGESLFTQGVVCSMELLEESIGALADYVESNNELDSARLGSCGLCMGAGFAFRAASIDARYRWCASLFPLFVDLVDPTSMPRWMRVGDWYNFQTGGVPIAEFSRQMALRDTDAFNCPFFLVHGKHDNWVSLDAAKELYDRVDSPIRDFLVLDSEPAYTGGNATTHAMPVGEQMHWVVPVVADWIAKRAGEISAS